MRRQRELAVRPYPQALLFDAAPRDEKCGRKRAQSRFESAHRASPVDPVLAVKRRRGGVRVALAGLYCMSAL
jgi:hypothetical protein